MKKTLLFSALLILAFTSQAFSCFSPTDLFAVEVVLNEPGADYDLTLIRSADNVSFDEGAFVYRSHFDKSVAVILREVNEVDILKGLSVRVQIPTETVLVDGVEDLIEAADLNLSKDDFDFKSAMKMELEWLSVNGIIEGISREDIAAISEISEAGLAGWNARIVYEGERWLPYNETSKPQLLRDKDCSGFDLEKLPLSKDTIILPGPSSVSLKGKLAASWGRIKSGI